MKQENILVISENPEGIDYIIIKDFKELVEWFGDPETPMDLKKCDGKNCNCEGKGYSNEEYHFIFFGLSDSKPLKLKEEKIVTEYKFIGGEK